MATKYDDDLPLKTIYIVESIVEEALRQGGTVQFHGSTLDLRNCKVPTYHPAQLPLLQGVVNGLYAAHRNPDRPVVAPSLRLSRKAYKQAWYNRKDHEIVLPQLSWAMNGMTLSHEVAHAAVGAAHNQRASHGRVWRRTFCAVARDLIGPEAGLLLQDAFDL